MAMVLEKTLTTHLAVLLTALLKFALLWTERSNTGGASVTSCSIATMVIVWANKEIFGKVSSQCLVKLSLSGPHIHFGTSRAKGGSLVSPDSHH